MVAVIGRVWGQVWGLGFECSGEESGLKNLGFRVGFWV